jgi:hypothetical protein
MISDRIIVKTIDVFQGGEEVPAQSAEGRPARAVLAFP